MHGARIDPRVLALAAALEPGDLMPVVLRFDPGDGVRLATPGLRRLGFVATAASPSEVAGDLPAGAVEHLAVIDGLREVSVSSRRRPR